MNAIVQRLNKASEVDEEKHIVRASWKTCTAVLPLDKSC